MLLQCLCHAMKVPALMTHTVLSIVTDKFLIAMFKSDLINHSSTYWLSTNSMAKKCIMLYTIRSRPGFGCHIPHVCKPHFVGPSKGFSGSSRLSKNFLILSSLYENVWTKFRITVRCISVVPVFSYEKHLLVIYISHVGLPVNFSHFYFSYCMREIYLVDRAFHKIFLLLDA